MRLFIAVEMPKEVKKALMAGQEQLDGQSAKLSLTKPQQLHLTLKFLGEVDEGMLEKLSSALRSIKCLKFSTALTGEIGVFPDERSPHVVWAALSNETTQLQRMVEEKLLSHGFPKEPRFTPHITLARIKSVADSRAFMESVHAITLEKKQFQVADFKLMKSTLAPAGPIHETLETFSLH